MSTWIWFLFVHIHLSIGQILPIYTSLQKRRLLFWCVDDGGAMTAECLQLALVLVIIARWSKDVDVIFTSDVICTTLTVDE